ncbi:hypothetical protein PRCB_00650 [Pantoea rodasii]|uniref:Uncharacterized protein n=1 Tax=Pantoea rodasii TaxID=1076549 RepID=A0A2M9WI15_9GAMM|nr:hypothetical protein PRCB_00650 [Pantoea rodasii]
MLVSYATGDNAAWCRTGASMRVVKKGTIVEASAPLLLQRLSAALRLLRWARSQSHGCDWQFGLAWMALPERSVGTTWKPRAPRQRREDGPAAAEVRWPALGHSRSKEKSRHFNSDSFCKYGFI